MYLGISSDDLVKDSLLESLAGNSINRFITVSYFYIYRGTWFMDNKHKRVLKIDYIRIDRLNALRCIDLGIEKILCGFITPNYNIDFYLKYLEYHNIEYNLDYNKDGSINWKL